MSSKLFLGSVALLTGAVIYEKNKHPTTIASPEELDPQWKHTKAYVSNGINGAAKSNGNEDFYYDNQPLHAHTRKRSYGIDDFYNNHDTDSSLSKIKSGLKEDVSSLKNAILHNHKNPPVSNYTRKGDYGSSRKTNGMKEDGASLENAVLEEEESPTLTVNRPPLVLSEDVFGNKSELETQLHKAEDEVFSLKRQLRSLEGTNGFTYEEKQAIDSNKSIMSGFGENASFFANEQYESVHGSPNDRFNTKDALPLLFDKTGRRLSDEEILKIQRDGLRGWGENAGWFAEEQYQSVHDKTGGLKENSLYKDTSLAEKSLDLKNHVQEESEKLFKGAEKPLENISSKMQTPHDDSLKEKKQDFNEAKNDWIKWGTTKINESEDKLKGMHTTVKDTTKSWWDWTKPQNDEDEMDSKEMPMNRAEDSFGTNENKFSKASDTLEEQADFINKRKN